MEGIDMVARLMALSAVTAPKSRGENFVCTQILEGDRIIKLSDAVRAYGERHEKKDFDRDAAGVAQSGAILLIGIKDSKPVGLDCGACGFTCCADLVKAFGKEKQFKGPVCAFRLLDMGIALGSAVKTAAMLNVDNRIMYRIGVVARDMGLVDWDYVMGIPLSGTGKNIYFDR